MKAIWNDTIIAESNDTIVIEGNHYFPHDSIKKEFYASSDTHSVCPWKGQAHYYTLDVNGKQNTDAAWFYPEVSELATSIKNRVAFWKGVQVVE
ncbi:DUF427 domain-containing protein [uncultured Dokdonia sp.]|uniref:DUF427 domain-containing protein n=1 Tax=uncultured Dokdonia sp. TaxID=575653 RepID=UPI00260929B7|nr:DUF427 domain-containing protein [uncultured Dokdonia sp.]